MQNIYKKISTLMMIFIFSVLVQANESYTKVHAHHILIKTQSEADKLLSKLNGLNGEMLKQEFITLARNYSIGPSSIKGGDLGWFKRGMMVPSFNDAVFSMEVGTVSKVVKTQFGYHLIYLADTKNKNLIIQKNTPIQKSKPVNKNLIKDSEKLYNKLME